MSRRKTRDSSGVEEHQAAQPAVLIARVRWLAHIRWFYAAMMGGLGLVVWLGARNQRDGLALLAMAAVAALYNVLVLAYLRHLAGDGRLDVERRIRHVTDAQIALDLVVLIAVLRFTGGVMNPLAGLVVFHVAVAASLLPRKHSYVQAALAGLLFALLSVVEGDRLWAAATWVVFLAILLLTVYFTDAILSRLRRINRRLVDANRQLSALNLTKSRFLRVSSHQLRGPLAAIHAMVSAMEAAGQVNEKQGDLVHRIRDRSAEMMKGLDEMMLLSTIKEDSVETSRRAPIEAGRVLAEAVARFAEEAKQRRVSLALETNGQSFVPAWEDALETICVHLLGNAVRYTPAGGRVSACVRRRGSRIELKVTDTGIGIPPDQKDRVFSEFFRATNARQISGGTGLGLSIVQAIVERLGGQVRLDSTQNEGTTVRVTLPLASELSAAQEGSGEPAELHEPPSEP